MRRMLRVPACRRRWAAAGVMLCLAMPARSAATQAARADGAAGAISGRVVDAATAQPLAGAMVTLEPRGTGIINSGRGAPAFLSAARAALTDTAGWYRFDGVADGEYRLHVALLGYHPATLEIDVRGAAASRVSVGLLVDPIELSPIEVSAPAGWTAAPGDDGAERQPAGSAPDEPRLWIEHLRQRLFLGADVRAVTQADVIEAVTLGETDLFRALQRLGGVSAPDAWSAQLWVRGAPWDQTRIYFDGLPLFNPLHAGGILSGVTPDAIGTAFLHRGVPPASLGGGAAGTLDLRSRTSRAEADDLRLAGALSLASARLSLDRTPADGQGGWTTTWRRSYLDWLMEVVQALGAGADVAWPYYFYDITAHYGDAAGSGRGLEISSLLEFDQVTGDIPDVLHRTVGSWGDGAVQAAYYAPIGGLRTRHAIGVSGFSSRIRPAPGAPELEASYSAPAAERSSNEIWYVMAGGSVEPRTAAAGGAWALGYELAGRHMAYSGLRPAWYTSPFVPGPREYLDGTLVTGVLWGERRWEPAPDLTINAGLRIEAGTPVRNGGAVRWMPRLAARYEINARSWASAAVGRTYQYAQALVPAGVTLRGFDTAYFWLLAGDNAPAARSDIVTLGLERWLGTRWLGAVSAYLRRTTGMTVPDPTPGPAVARPLFVIGRNLARGIEFSVRRLAGRWTFSAAYALGVSEMEAVGLRFPAPADRRHTFDATTMWRLGRGWRLGAAYTIESGAPYTRRHYGVRSCADTVECEWAAEPQAGSPGAYRAPSRRSVDLLLDWTHLGDDWELGLFLQLRNALNHRNHGRYLRFDPHYCARSCGSIRGVEFGYEGRDEFEFGLPILPLFGFRVVF